MQQNQFPKELAELFKSKGYQLRMVGGAVRDMIAGELAHDLDFCTDATPVAMMNMVNDTWRVFPTGIDHGTVTFMSLFGSFEVTTLRIDKETDGRHAIVEFTNDWKADAARRDFTVNAMSMDSQGNVYDYFGGKEDLKNRKLKFVGNPETRINEDALRIARFWRFFSKFGWCADFDSYSACIKNAYKLQYVSAERVWQETQKATKSDFVNYLRQMIESEAFVREGFVGRFDKSKLDFATQIQKHKAEFCIAAVLSPEDCEKFADTYKLSNQERMKMQWFVAHKDDKITLEYAQDQLFAYDTPVDWMIELSNFNGGFNPEAIKAIAIEKTRFPLTGQDLIDAGMKQGKGLGDALKKAKDSWQESRFTKNKEQLLKEVV